MTLSIPIPPHAEELLRNAFGEALNRTTLDAILVEGYRVGKLSRFDIQRILGFDNRWDTDEWLGSHGAHLNYSAENLDADRNTLNQVLGPVKT
jgi:hypothetical protein